MVKTCSIIVLHNFSKIVVVHGQQTRRYNLSYQTTVHELKGMVSSTEKIDTEAMDLSYKGKILADDKLQMFVEDYFPGHNSSHEVLLIER